MADAVCGPSNPLQQFKQQSQLDRTLQQDRLTSRHSPAQGFRSANPNVGLLDPEFEAFQAGLPAPDLPQYHHQQQQFPSPSFASSSQAPAWATDFQRMHISSPPPFAQHQVSQAGPATANWTQGFREHIAQNAPRAQNSSPSPLAFQQSARYGYNGYQSNFQHRSYASPLVQSKGKELATDQFDDAAFERAFDQARDEMMMEEGAMSEGIETDVPILQKKTNASESDVLNNTMHDIDDASVQEALPLVNITDDETEALREALDRQEETQAAEPMQQEEDDALAATAQELLEKVEHNPTDKFRNSQFLNLIRKLRDREVKVEGDKMVEQTAGPAAAAAAQETSSLNNAPSTANSPSSVYGFDNSEQRPSPLDGVPQPQDRNGPVDSRPPEYSIPAHEQDHDLGRVEPRDGQEVVDLLNRPGLWAGDDIGTFLMSPPDDFQPRKLYARSESQERRGANLSEMLYGADGTLSAARRGD